MSIYHSQYEWFNEFVVQKQNTSNFVAEVTV
jgi:hypothetical protein